MRRQAHLLIALVSLLTTFRSGPVFVGWEQADWIAASPRPARPAVPALAADLDSDGSTEWISLTGGQLTVFRYGVPLWKTPPEWDVASAQMADLNRDGRMEVAMAVWRPFQPWPVDAWQPYGGRIAGFQDAQNRSCHIILWGWGGTRFRELWAGSALAEPVLAFFAADWNDDGRDELMTVESAYDHPAQGIALALWDWNGFGFSLAGRRNTSIRRFVWLIDPNGLPAVLLESGDGWFDIRRGHD